MMDMLRLAKKCLVKSNETRWNSVYFMLKSVMTLSEEEMQTILTGGKNDVVSIRKVSDHFLDNVELE